jgi:hypothetical protein
MDHGVFFMAASWFVVQIYKKLEKELQEKKKEMAHIIEISNLA